MKYITSLFITLIYTTYSIYPMEEEKKHNTQGIRPLFDPSDKASMEHFNRSHKKMVNYTNGHVLSAAHNNEEYRNYLLCAQDYFKQLRHQCNEKGSENYLAELIQHHEKSKKDLVAQAVQAIDRAAQKQDIQSSSELDHAMTTLQKKAELIQELEHIQNRNRIVVIEDVDGDNYDSGSSNDSESAVD